MHLGCEGKPGSLLAEVCLWICWSPLGGEGCGAGRHDGRGAGALQGIPQGAALWWPPVAHALRALGLLYGALDAKTFGGLAQDTVAAATTSVQAASRAVAKRAFPSPASHPGNGHCAAFPCAPGPLRRHASVVSA